MSCFSEHDLLIPTLLVMPRTQKTILKLILRFPISNVICCLNNLKENLDCRVSNGILNITQILYTFLYIYICIQIYRFVLAEHVLENKFLENPHIKIGGVLLGKEIGLWEIGERNS